MPAATAVGVASTKAQGQATTSTATLREISRVTQNVMRRRHEDQGDEVAGIPVGQALHRGLRRFGMLHQMNDLLQRRVVPETLDGQFQRAVGIQRAGKNFVADPFFGRQRLAGNRALIDPRRAADDPPVDGDPIAGPHDDDVVGPNIRDVYFLFLVSAADAGRMRPKCQQTGDARARAADGEVFQRLADEHDENDFGRDEEPGRRIGPRASRPKGPPSPRG